MKQYEYTYHLYADTTHGQLLTLMNSLGQQGWRTVQVFEQPKGFFAVLVEKEIIDSSGFAKKEPYDNSEVPLMIKKMIKL